MCLNVRVSEITRTYKNTKCFHLTFSGFFSSTCMSRNLARTAGCVLSWSGECQSMSTVGNSLSSGGLTTARISAFTAWLLNSGDCLISWSCDALVCSHCRGSTLLFPTHSFQNSGNFWPRHTEFLPERFLPEGQEKLGPTTVHATMPFGAGARMCPVSCTHIGHSHSVRKQAYFSDCCRGSSWLLLHVDACAWLALSNADFKVKESVFINAGG